MDIRGTSLPLSMLSDGSNRAEGQLFEEGEKRAVDRDSCELERGEDVPNTIHPRSKALFSV